MQSNQPLRLNRWLQTLIQAARWGAILSLITMILISALLLYLRLKPLPPVQIEQTTLLFDQDGQVFEQLHGGINRLHVELERIPHHLIAATIAVEDRSFYEHLGLDWKRMAKAAAIDLKYMEFRQGASTISQQLARNLYLTLEKTWSRKIKEALLALQLELHWSKEKILETYLNQIYYGHGAYGIQVAAQLYFNKDVSQLNLGEATMLVGIPKGPTYYSPLNNYPAAKKRQQMVLQAMVREKMISEEEAEQAYATPLPLQTKRRMIKSSAPYFRDAVLQEAEERYGLSAEQIQRSGLRIYTTFDPELQEMAEQAIKDSLPGKSQLQVALVALDPRSGQVRALIGGREYSSSHFNRITQGVRHPGSTMKPLLYLTALEEGFTPITRIESKPTIFHYDGDQTYEPINFDHHYLQRPITMQEAIKTSDNIYAVTTHMVMGPEKLVQMAKRMGIETPLQPYPSLALGAQGLTPLQLTSAYAIIANEGKRLTPHFIKRIERADGSLLVQAVHRSEKVAQPLHTFLLTQMMMTIFDEGGTGHRVRNYLPHPVAAKTGTTGMDAWMIGFTPDLVSTVWLGYDRERKLNHAETVPAAQIWARFMGNYLQQNPSHAFPIPVGVERITIDSLNGKRADPARCKRVEQIYVKRGTVPQNEWSDCSTTGREENIPPPAPQKKTRPFWQRLFPW